MKQEIESVFPALTDNSSSSTTETASNSSGNENVKKSLKSTNDLSNHLPTGTLLLYQLLSPIVTRQGHCHSLERILTTLLVGVCSILCFVLSFTDSFKDKKGNLCHGIATIRGLWVIDGSEQLSAKDSEKYKLQEVDFLHAFLTLLVFVSVALSDVNIVGCFFPRETEKVRWILMAIPVGISGFCSALFVAFPTKRRGIGFPVSS